MKGIKIFKQEAAKIPHDPRDWKGFFQCCHLDDCNGERTPQTHTQIVPMCLIDDEDFFCFEGTASRWEHPKSRCSFNNHTNGMHFAIVCNSHGIGQSFIWLREVDNVELTKILKEGTIVLEGSSPDVPNYKCSGKVTLHLESKNHVLYLDKIQLRVEKKDYEEWIKVL